MCRECKEYCVVCNQDVKGEVKKKPLTAKVEGKIIQYIGEYMVCPQCNSVLANKEILENNKRKIKEACERIEKVEKNKRKEKDERRVEEKRKKKVVVGIVTSVTTIVASAVAIIMGRGRKN